MPSANIYVASAVADSVREILPEIRSTIAVELSTKRKVLGPEQVSLRLTPADPAMQLARIEVEVFGHAFWHRLRRLDQRSHRIAHSVSQIAGEPTSCWINLSFVGYARSPRE